MLCSTTHPPPPAPGELYYRRTRTLWGTEIAVENDITKHPTTRTRAGEQMNIVPGVDMVVLSGSIWVGGNGPSRARGGRSSPPFPEPPPPPHLLGSRDGDPRRTDGDPQYADGEVWGVPEVPQHI